MSFHSDYKNLFLRKEDISDALKDTGILLPEAIFGPAANRATQSDAFDYSAHQEFQSIKNRTVELQRQLEQEQAARKAAESELLELRAQIDGMAKQLSGYHAGQQMEVKPDMQAGLTFPYITKDLEVMRDAAVKFWVSHTPDKRQPSQKEVGLMIGEALGLEVQKNGEAARKAQHLASVIKPDVLT